jgi:hypothetical protein
MVLRASTRAPTVDALITTAVCTIGTSQVEHDSGPCYRNLTAPILALYGTLGTPALHSPVAEVATPFATFLTAIRCLADESPTVSGVEEPCTTSHQPVVVSHQNAQLFRVRFSPEVLSRVLLCPDCQNQFQTARRLASLAPACLEYQHQFPTGRRLPFSV